jgi:hypothetical protein
LLDNLSGTTIIPVKIRLNNGFEFTSDVALGQQIGVFIGTDHINGNKYRDGTDRINWDHQGKPWISIGLGYSILSRPTKREKVSEKENGNE